MTGDRKNSVMPAERPGSSVKLLQTGNALFLTILLVASAPISAQEPASSDTLPFDPLPYTALSGNQRKVFAHYFTPFPPSIDNRVADQDYYATHYLNPDGENGRYKEQGGYLRQRPLPRPVSQSPDWKFDDIRHEIRLAKAIGLDGFSLDLLALGGIQWERARLVLEAAEAEGHFEIMLMPDMNAALRNEPERLTGMVEELSRYPAAMRLDDGRLVVSPYMAGKQSPDWWAGRLDELRQQGIRVAFVPLFHDWFKHYEDYASLSYGVSDWGARRISTVRAWTKMANIAHASGLKWMAPVVPQDVRPKNSIYWETGNSELFRAQWLSAIDGGADWVHLITWNDYSEHSEIRPSTATGYAFYDLTAYYCLWFKTGQPPPIKRDAIYSFYRVHPVDSRPDPDRQRKMMVPARSSDRPLNRIELLAFLTAPGTLEIELAHKVHRKPADSGVTSFTIPLQSGTPVFRIVRDGTVVATLRGNAIHDNIAVQDLLYHGASSLR